MFSDSYQMNSIPSNAMIIVSCWDGLIPTLPTPWHYFLWCHFEPNDSLPCDHMFLAFAKQPSENKEWDECPSGNFFLTKINFSKETMNTVYLVIKEYMTKDKWKLLKGEWDGGDLDSDEEVPEGQPTGVISTRCWTGLFLCLAFELKVKLIYF